MVSKAIDSLDCPGAVRLCLRHRIPNHFHFTSHICHRCLPYLLRECIGFFDDFAKHCRCSVPPCRRPSLRKTRSIVGNFGSWICQSELCPYSIRITLFRTLDPKAKFFLPAFVGGRYAQIVQWDQNTSRCITLAQCGFTKLWLMFSCMGTWV